MAKFKTQNHLSDRRELIKKKLFNVDDIHRQFLIKISYNGIA